MLLGSRFEDGTLAVHMLHDIMQSTQYEHKYSWMCIMHRARELHAGNFEEKGHGQGLKEEACTYRTVPYGTV